MLDIITQGADTIFGPFYHFGVAVWDFMLSLIGLTAAQTPRSFSTATWNYICNDLYPWTSAIGATILNISFYIGFIRQANNLKQNVTLEVFVECCIKVVVGNTLLVSGLSLMRQILEIASGLAGNILLETPVVFAQEDTDLGSVMFYAFFGVIFFIVCIVCSGLIFFTYMGVTCSCICWWGRRRSRWGRCREDREWHRRHMRGAGHFSQRLLKSC